MLVGVDFDNTIVCYDQVFPREAIDRGLVPNELATSKTAIRDYLRKTGQEDRWTELQGIAYGPGMGYATPFPGVVEFFEKCRQANLETRVISHRTQFPYLGEKFDLHQSARNWLAASELGVPSEHIYFELTKAEKLNRIAITDCTHFVDDLPEFLSDPNFPRGVHRILFDPGDIHQPPTGVAKARSWLEIEDILMAGR
jgi:hypothetical protein